MEDKVGHVIGVVDCGDATHNKSVVHNSSILDEAALGRKLLHQHAHDIFGHSIGHSNQVCRSLCMGLVSVPLTGDSVHFSSEVKDGTISTPLLPAWART